MTTLPGLGNYMRVAHIFVVIIGLALYANAQTETILYNFGAFPDGSQPQASVVADASGNLYGTTGFGGASGVGMVFKLTHTTDGWQKSALWNFTGGKDGAQPCGLVFDGAGNLYGATSNGGAYNLGVVYKLSPTASGTWRQTVIHTFAPAQGAATPPISWYPSTLVIDGAGNLYGTTLYGGSHRYGGTVYKLSPKATGGYAMAVLYQFTGGSDGQYPATRSLTLDSQGHLYGTTNSGGPFGAGVVFKLTPTPSGAWTQSIVYAFTGQKDGAAPNGGLIFDKAGNLYGTTSAGGSTKCYPGCGVVFRLSPTASGTWIQRQLYVFEQQEAPYGGLIADPAGSLYGTTTGGGANGFGTVFKLSPTATGSWTKTVLHDFAGYPAQDGFNPHGTLLRDAAGNLYGTAFTGGSFFNGVVFEVTP